MFVIWCLEFDILQYSLTLADSLLSRGPVRKARSVYSLIIYPTADAGSSPSTLAVYGNGDNAAQVGGTFWCGLFYGHCDALLPGDGGASRGKRRP